MFVKQSKKVAFEDFVKRYCDLVETRLLTDFSIDYRTYTYNKLIDVFGFLEHMYVNPLKFLDFCFKIYDGLPFPEVMMKLIQSYREEPGQELTPTIYDIVYNDFIRIEGHSKDFLFFIRNNIHPFIATQNKSVKLFVYQGMVPNDWLLWDDDLLYFNKVRCCFYLLKRFKKMQRFLYELFIQ
jgi:hypothetical protein